MKKLTIEQARKAFEEKGCELLETEIKNVGDSLRYRCKCGNISQTNISNIRKSGRCIKCGGCSRYTLEFVKAFFEKYGCKLLSKNYKSKNDKLKFKCSCGRIGHVSFSNFKKTNRHKCCRECWKKTFSGEHHYNWQVDREKLKNKQHFHRRCCTMLFNVLRQMDKNKTSKTKDLLGYGPGELQAHIENHPNWSNYKDVKWNIDHIFPVSAFVRFGIFDLKIINSLDNLQPLVREDNISKADKFDEKEFLVWLSKKIPSFNEEYGRK